MNPFDWTAGPFLSFYALLAAVTLISLAWWHGHLGDGRSGGQLDGLDAFEIAYLAGGAKRAHDTALVGLLEAGALQTTGRGGRLEPNRSADLPPRLHQYWPEMQGATSRIRFRGAMRGREKAARADLAARGLIAPGAAQANYVLLSLLTLCALSAFGILRISNGIARDKPVGFLTLLVILTFITGLIIISRSPYRTPAGRRALKTFKHAKSRAIRAPMSDEVMLAFALGGAAVLADRPYQSVFRSNGSGDSGGCGSSVDSGGGDSGGGGDGGGGCGGCGG